MGGNGKDVVSGGRRLSEPCVPVLRPLSEGWRTGPWHRRGRWARGPGASLAGVVVRARVRRCVGLVLWLVCMNLVRVPVSVLCVLRLPPVFLNRVRACVLPVESYHAPEI